jgi:AcrR family transcriptional regulator
MVERSVRDAILHEATRLFAARGFDGTAVQDVADAVGVSKPSVLHHFPSKEALRGAVLEAMLAHWQRTLPQLLVAATASEARFDAVLGELHAFFSSDPDRARLVMREVLDRPVEMKKLLRKTLSPWIEAIAAYIREGRERGRHHHDVDPEAYVLHVLQLVISAVASADVTSAVLEKGARDRYDRELARIARTSLYTTPSTSPARGKSARTRR